MHGYAVQDPGADVNTELKGEYEAELGRHTAQDSLSEDWFGEPYTTPLRELC